MATKAKRTSSSIDDFCARHAISRAHFNKMRKLGLGPDTIKLGNAIRITDLAEERFLADLEGTSSAASRSPASQLSKKKPKKKKKIERKTKPVVAEGDG